jgi:hypothetical protein
MFEQRHTPFLGVVTIMTSGATKRIWTFVLAPLWFFNVDGLMA